MGVLANIGDKAGEAAPGEYGPRALLTTAGLVVGRNAAGVGQIIPPGYPTVDLGRAYTPSATTEGSLLNAGAATTGLFAAGVAVGDMWEIFLSGTLLNNSGTSTYTSTIKVYFGAFPIGSQASAALTSSATTREWAWSFRVYIETIGGSGAGTLRVSGRRLGLDNVIGVGTGYKTLTANTYAEDVAESTGTSSSPALITNAASDFNVTATHSNATAAMTTTLSECLVRYYPKNR